eukprot:SAG11_NODE_383_length_9899_cov_10.535510_5_plen_55_part_00
MAAACYDGAQARPMSYGSGSLAAPGVQRVGQGLSRAHTMIVQASFLFVDGLLHQ